MAITEEVYETLAEALYRNRINEEAEDILLALAEELADMGVDNKEITYKEKVGAVDLEVSGVCEPNPDDPDEVSVYLKWVKVGKKIIEIEDYFL